MLAKIPIVITIMKQIVSALENPFGDRTSQTQDVEENIWTNFNFDTLSYLPVVAKKGCMFSLLSVGGRWRVLMDSLCVAC